MTTAAISSRWSCLLFFVSLFSACHQHEGQRVLGTVFRVDGIAVANERKDIGRSRPLSAGSQFAQGEDIRILPEGSAFLCLTPGIYLRCFGPAQIQIEELRVSKDGDETGNSMKLRQAAVRLIDGRIHAFLPRAGLAPSDLKITTAAGTIVASAGALFSIALTPASIRIVCLRGELNWNNQPTFSSSIGAGYYCERKITSRDAANILPVSDDAAAQKEVVETIDSASHLDDLEEAKRKTLAPWIQQ